MPTEPRRRLPVAAVLAAAALLAGAPAWGPLSAQIAGPTGPVAAVRIEGAETIPEAVLLQKIAVRPGRPATNAQLREGVHALHATKWFSRVTPEVRETEAGPVVVYTVKELPVLKSVAYVGNEKKSDEQLKRVTGLEPGSPYRVTFNRDAAEQLRRYYVSEGFRHARVTLTRGDSPDDRVVAFRIEEGPKVRVADVTIEGNAAFRDSLLKRDLETKSAWVFDRFFGLFDPQTVPRDEAKLTDYYRGLGFFDVKVTADVAEAPDRGLVNVTFRVEEGPRYRIRDVLIEGNRHIPTSQLRPGDGPRGLPGRMAAAFGFGGPEPPALAPGDYYNARLLRRDIDRMNDLYGSKGRLFTKITPEPVFGEGNAGEIDLVFSVDEDKVRYVRHVNASIRGDHPHTKTSLIHNSLLFAPGDVANPALIRKSKSRIGGQPAFAQNVELTIRPVEAGPVVTAGGVRGQNPAAGPRPPARTASLERRTPPRWDPAPPRSGPAGFTPPLPGERSSWLFPRPPTLPPAWETSAPAFDDRPEPLFAAFPESPAPPVAGGKPVIRGQSPPPSYATWGPAVVPVAPAPPPVVRFQNVTADAVYAAPAPGVNPYKTVRQVGGGDPGVTSPLFNQSPQGDPFGGPFGPSPPFQEPPGFVDIDVAATEERTGRFMVGAAVNSSSGVVGQLTLQEDNFDIFRFPRSFQDVRNGTAFRGAGQRLRIEAVPGAQVSRYTVSLSDPFFLDTIYSAGISGFYFSRFYDEYDEQRLGGRINVGRQLSPFWSVVGTSRLESVKIFGATLGDSGAVPQKIAEAVGDNALFTVGASLKYDSRDRAILPGEGTFAEIGYTQGLGDFTYPKFDAELWRYFTLAERPDGTGQHVLSLNGTLGIAGGDIPVFESYYLGGFQTLRGYDFRGVSPLQDGVRVGGTFQAYGSVQYRFPILVNDALQGVVFTDFGTVNDSVSLDDFRATVGAGLRVSLPQAFGPAPLAFDFAVPVAGPDFDDERLFSFQVGVQR